MYPVLTVLAETRKFSPEIDRRSFFELEAVSRIFEVFLEMAYIFNVDKSSKSVLDYSIDWSKWLEDGDTIDSSSWSVTNGLTIESTSFTTTKATVWLSGGTPGVIYEAVNTIVTGAGRTEVRTIAIKIVKK